MTVQPDPTTTGPQERVTEYITNVTESVTENVKVYPVAALIIAGAIGIGVGYLLSIGTETQRRPARRHDRRRARREPRRVIGDDVPDESKERHTEIAVEAGQTPAKP